jgi:hypothetical protein
MPVVASLVLRSEVGRRTLKPCLKLDLAAIAVASVFLGVRVYIVNVVLPQCDLWMVQVEGG